MSTTASTPPPAGDQPADTAAAAAAAAPACRNLRRSAIFDRLCAEYLRATKARAAAEGEAKACKAEILRLLAGSPAGLGKLHRAELVSVAGFVGTMITKAMVGTYLGARRASSRLEVTPLGAPPSSACDPACPPACPGLRVRAEPVLERACRAPVHAGPA